MKKFWWIFPLIAIIALGAYMRLHNIEGYMTFLGDEGRDVLVVKRMIVDHKFTLLGPTASVGGFFLGPIYYYFMLPFLWAWNLSPVGPAIMVALFGIATIFLVFWVGKAFFNLWVGLMSALLYAISPLVIAYSRSSWNPNLVPFFSLLLSYLLWLSVDKSQALSMQKRNGILVAIGVVLGIGLQLHYLFLFLFPVVAIWFLSYRKTVPLMKVILFTLLGFLIGYAPFLAFELRHGFPNTQSIMRFIFASSDTGVTPNMFTTIDMVLFRSFGRLLYRLPDGAVWDTLPVWQMATWMILIRTTVCISVLLLAAIVARTFGYGKTFFHWVSMGMNPLQQERLSRACALLLVWLGMVVFSFSLYHKAIYDYYFGIFFAVPFLLVSFVLYVIGKSTFGKILAVGLFGLLIYFNWLGRPFQYTPNNQLAQARSIAVEALSHTEGRPFNFALITGANSDHTYRYFFEIAGATPVTIENTQIDPERKTVTDQLIVICELADCKPLGHPLWEIAGFGRAEIAGSWDISFVKIFRLIHYTGK